VLVTVVAATFAACETGPGISRPSGDSMDLVDFAFEPDTIAIRAGAQVTIRVANTGKVLHNITIPAIEAGVDYQPGQSSNLIFLAPSAEGPVEFFCTYHRDQGMVGRFIVR
jgi:plastocyanin